MALPSGTVERLVSAVDDILDIVRIRRAALDNFYLPAHQDFQKKDQLRRAMLAQCIALLEPYVQQVRSNQYRPAGYRSEELASEADISPQLFRVILRLTNVKPTERGHHQRTFSNAEIRLLINGAQQHGTKKSLGAAKAWQSLIDQSSPGVPRT